MKKTSIEYKTNKMVTIDNLEHIENIEYRKYRKSKIIYGCNAVEPWTT